MKKSVKKSSEFTENLSSVFETEPRYSQQLDNLISKMYTFVDVIDEDVKREPKVEPCYNVDHSILIYFDSVCGKSEEEKRKEKEKKKRMFKRKPKFHEKISFEDICSVVVSGEWILKKQGIYGKGRERRGEEVTGAVHSLLYRKLLNKND